MAKKKFYSFSRYTDKTDNVVKMGYLPREGFPVPNDYLLDLAVYRGTSSAGVKEWYVVDCRCGLSIGSGYTRTDAMRSAISRLSKVNMEAYEKKVYDHCATYGYAPGYGISYL